MSVVPCTEQMHRRGELPLSRPLARLWRKACTSGSQAELPKIWLQEAGLARCMSILFPNLVPQMGFSGLKSDWLLYRVIVYFCAPVTCALLSWPQKHGFRYSKHQIQAGTLIFHSREVVARSSTWGATPWWSQLGTPGPCPAALIPTGMD